MKYTIKGTSDWCMKTSEDENDNHSIQDFTQYINSLPEGHYIFKNGQFVKVK